MFTNVLVQNFSQNEEVTLTLKLYLHLNDSRNKISKVFKKIKFCATSHPTKIQIITL